MDDKDKPYFYYPKCCLRPLDYNIPEVEELKTSLQHPELNTFDFRFNVEAGYKTPQHFLPIFSHVDTQNGNFVVATNRFTGLLFDSMIISTSDFDSIRNSDVNNAKLVSAAPMTITALKLLDLNLVSNIFTSLCHDINFPFSSP